MKNVIKYLEIILISIVLIFTVKIYNTITPNKSKNPKETINIDDTTKTYVINYIKKHEGFRANVYNDAMGNPTIGYGHLIKINESFGTLTEEQAHKLLLADLEIAHEAAITLSPNLNDSVNVFKKWAIAHFIYGKGSGNYANSTLRRKVNNNEPIDNEMLKWNILTINGKRSKSDYLHEINIWRINLYNKSL